MNKIHHHITEKRCFCYLPHASLASFGCSILFMHISPIFMSPHPCIGMPILQHMTSGCTPAGTPFVFFLVCSLQPPVDLTFTGRGCQPVPATSLGDVSRTAPVGSYTIKGTESPQHTLEGTLITTVYLVHKLKNLPHFSSFSSEKQQIA